MGYATPADLATYSPMLNHPDDVAGYIRAASRLVGRAVRRATYDVDGAGLPTDATILAALRDATCEQVTQWTRAGVDPTGPVTTVAEPGVVTSRTTTSGPRTVTEAYAGPITPPDTDCLGSEALGILGDAGLLYGAVWAVRGR